MAPFTLLQLTPDKAIEFPSVKLQSSSVDLNVKNAGQKVVAYKIKTTAPKNYLVRPSTGVVSPGESQTIQIILQPQQSIPESNTDRFLVQAIEVEALDVQLTKEFWSNVPKTLLQDHRLSVVFKPTNGNGASPRPAASGIAPAPVPSSAAPVDAGAEYKKVAATFPPSTSSNFETKYNELLQYCLALDKQKLVATNELNECRQQVESLTQRLKTSLCRSCGGPVDVPRLDGVQANGVVARQCESLWPVAALVVAVVILLKYFNFL